VGVGAGAGDGALPKKPRRMPLDERGTAAAEDAAGGGGPPAAAVCADGACEGGGCAGGGGVGDCGAEGCVRRGWRGDVCWGVEGSLSEGACEALCPKELNRLCVGVWRAHSLRVPVRVCVQKIIDQGCEFPKGCCR